MSSPWQRNAVRANKASLRDQGRLNVEFSTVQLRGQQLVTAATLVKSLGGGWENLMKE
jgi:hypothetical protein